MVARHEHGSEHPLCSTCRFTSVCVLSPLSSTYCEAYSQKKRDRDTNGARPTHHKWEAGR